MVQNGAPTKLLIDTDPGIDDSQAILAAFNSPEVEVIGLTTIFGNVPTPLATRNAIFLKELAGKSEIPVAEGSHKSLRGVAKEHLADFVHGSDGFGNTAQPLPKGAALPTSAAQFTVDMANKHPGQVTYLALASLTNLALALHLDPDLPDKLGRIVVLGGAFYTSGNVNPAAEANIFGDADAANVVLSRAKNCWVLGLDVTHECKITQEELEGLEGRGRFGSFIYLITQFYLQYHQRMYKMDAVYVHDAAAFAAVLRPDLFDWKEGKIVVVADGPCKGRTVLDECKRDWVGHNAWVNLPVVKVALGVNSKDLVAWVLDRMGR